ncbi:hypothetical protein EIN_485590 [Entamoeba invadens IP1]|uniref:Uncharacterized protein n=1 Tax=Entamoeba invadens IP1 TaxID=370355 RepID=A0A0A1U4H9_ENTIV|nr:hypothetical protein EIN_485590 [Entamoeba invadens IP1]ELP89167.1 hypothetical protein EIN_485590 [Entamoeba invadens IP1]|eukprot:XP_004255938.1 hypothetical protein EIN_485590 [Entamoeba invadens IP1]
MKKAKPVKCLLLGESGVGKTACVQRLVETTFDNMYTASVGVDFKIKEIPIGDEVVRIELWDTAGQERFRSITKTYYRGSDAAVVMFSLTDKNSFDRIAYWLNEMQDLQKRPIVVLAGNKCDLTSERSVFAEEVTAAFPDLKYFETSAESGKNITEVFQCLAQTYVDLLHKPLEAKKMRESFLVRSSSSKSLSIEEIDNIPAAPVPLVNADEPVLLSSSLKKKKKCC